MKKIISPLLLTLATVGSLVADETEDQSVIQLSPFAVQTQRITAYNDAAISYTQIIASTKIIEQAPHDISDLLFADPSISSFRGYANRVAHPGSQGIRIRNIGANATSRALVLLDGIPQNDPFGGWIYWNRYNPSSLGSVTVSPSGNSEVWGNYGAGGLVSMHSNYNFDGSQNYSLFVGTDGSFGGSLGTDIPVGTNKLVSIQTRYHDAVGHIRIHPDQRGPADIEAGAESKNIRGTLFWETNSDWEIKTTLDHFNEKRNNGIPLADNETTANDISTQAYKALTDDSSLQVIAYYQERDFPNKMVSVRGDNRDEYRLVLDQYDVPADAIGASASYSHDLGNIHYITGIDFRHINGSVNERTRNLGDGFTRTRHAGGEQDMYGAFLGIDSEISDKTTVGSSFRVDQIELKNGYRFEKNINDGSYHLNEQHPNRENFEHSINLSANHSFNDNIKGRIAAFTGFRAPTLNELYRPYRVKDDIVECNPELAPERFNGIETNLNYTDEEEKLALKLSFFHYKLDDLIANAWLHNNPGPDELVGFVPPGGSASQRRNIEETTSTGIEIESNIELTDILTLDFKYTYTRSEIQSNDINPVFNGKDLPQSPRNRGYAQINWVPSKTTRLWARVSSYDEQYEDLHNARRIEGATTIDLGVSTQLDENSTLSFRIENLTNEIIETGLSTSGLISTGVERSAWIQYDLRLQ